MTELKTFETERLILKPTSVEDAEFFFNLKNSPTWIQYIGDRNVKTIEDARAFITSKIITHREKFGYSNYTVIKKIDSIKIGSCGYYNREDLEGVDVGCAFLPKYQKMGYAYEAGNKIISISFEEFGLTSLKAVTTNDNIPTQRLLEKLGFNFIGKTILLNEKEESLLYEINLA